MRSFTSSRPVWSASRVARATCTSSSSSVRSVHGRARTTSSHPWIQPRSVCCSGMRSNLPSSLRSCLTTSSCTPAASSASMRCAVVVDGLAAVGVVAELLADGVHLAAEQVLALLVLEAVADVARRSWWPARARPGPPWPSPSTRRTRASTSTVSSSSTLRSVDSSGHQPTRSASAPGSSPATEPRMPLTCRLPEVLEQRPQRGPQLDAEAPGLVGDARCVLDGLGRDPQARARCRPRPGPRGPGVMARTTSAWVPPGSCPVDSTVADHARPWRRCSRSGGRAAACSSLSSAACAAALASSDSSEMVTTIPGSSTSPGRGRTGSVLCSVELDTGALQAGVDLLSASDSTYRGGGRHSRWTGRTPGVVGVPSIPLEPTDQRRG